MASILSEPPYAADLVLYRSLDGTSLHSVFHLAPSERASEVILKVGYENVRIQPYPYALPRSQIIGPEGGRVSGEGDVVVEIPPGATVEPVRAESRTLAQSELESFGTIPGFRIAGGFELAMQRFDQEPTDLDGDGIADPGQPIDLWKPARVTFGLGALEPDSQVILAQVLDATPYGRIFQLASRTSPLPPGEGSGERTSTLNEDPTTGLPNLGITTEGRYLILVAEQPMAWAWGTIKTASGRLLPDAQILSLDTRHSPLAALGVSSLTPTSGLFAIPVVADPAPAFQLDQRHHASGEGDALPAPERSRERRDRPDRRSHARPPAAGDQLHDPG